VTREETPQARDHAKLEETGFEDFFRSQYRTLLTTLMSVGATLAEAEDAAQAAFMDTFNRWEHINSPNAYVRTAAVRQFINTRSRSRQGVRHAVHALETPSEVDAAADRDLTVWEGQQWVEQVLDLLTPTQREVVALTIDGLSTKEIAEILGKSAPNVRQHLSLARERLRKVVERGAQEGWRGAEEKPDSSTDRDDNAR
jgi:RNA polymerase sigma factor (sigma-70 family)